MYGMCMVLSIVCVFIMNGKILQVITWKIAQYDNNY